MPSQRRFAAGLGLCAALGLLGAACAVNRSQPLSRDQVLQSILPSAAQILVERDGRRVRSGSGVVIAARPSAQGGDCYVLTSGHTLARSPEEGVFVMLGGDQKAKAKVRASILAKRETADLDLGLLRVPGADCPVARFGEPPDLGDEIWVVAFPWGRHLTLVSGVVSQVNEDLPADQEPGPRLMVDASVSYGASGGGVFDAHTGGLVGVVDSYRTARLLFKVDAHPAQIDLPVPGETFVIPLTDIRRFLKEVEQAHLTEASNSTAAEPRRR